MKRKTKALAIIAGAAAATAGMALPASAVPVPNGEIDLIYVGGSDTTYELMQDLGSLYSRAYGCNQTVTKSGVTAPLKDRCILGDGTPYTPADFDDEMLRANPDHDVVVNLYPRGSSIGVNQVNNQGGVDAYGDPVQYIDLARSSRNRRATDNSSLRWVAYAAEALPWSAAVNQGLPNNLTQSQLVNIYTGCAIDPATGNPIQPPANNWITNWSQVGGPNRPIVIYAAQSGSGTAGTFDSFIAGDARKCIPPAFKDGGADDHVIFENNPRPIFANADEAGAIFYYSGGRFRENREKSMFLGRINGIQPTPDNVATFTYPFSRYVWNVYRDTYPAGNASQAVKNFAGLVAANGEMGFLCKGIRNAGQRNSSGFNEVRQKSWAQLIEETIVNHGFAPLPAGNTDLDGDLGIPNRSTCRVED